jgi:PAS domain S-box-containing protein
MKDNSLNGNVVGGMGIVADITKHKHIDEELRLACQRFLDIIDFLPDATFVIDRDRKVIAWNKAIEKLTGVHKQDLLGKGNYAYSVPFYGEPRPMLIDLVYGDDPEVKSQYIYVEKEGNTLYAEAVAPFLLEGRETYLGSTASSLLDSHGNVVGAIESIRNITERHLAEDGQKESRDYLNKIINSIGDPIFVKDRNHRFGLVNDVLCNLMGHLREDIIGRTDHDFFPKDQADVFWEKDEVVFELGNENINDEKITDVHGMIHEITTKKTLYKDNAGNQFIVGIFRDITDRKRAEDALQEARNYLENLFNYANAPIIVWDPAFRISRFNHAFEHLTGYKAEDVIGQRLEILFPESSRDASFSKIDRTLAGEYWESVEIPIHHKEGAVRIVLWNSANIYADDGKTLLATIAQGTDITERKVAEEAIKESERRLADIINFLPDATLVIDQDGKVIAWNHAIEEMTGIKAEEILGKSNYEYAIPFYGERIPILIDLVLKPQEEVEKRYTDLRRKDGTLVGGAYMPALKGGGTFLVGSAAALYDSEGNISGAIESIRDVTENKHVEEELRKAMEDAESAMSAKAAFLANMSHELRTPMNAVIGFSSLLLDDTLNPEHRDYIEGIRNGGEALLAIINDILDFTKAERNRIELEHQPLSLKHLIDESLGMVVVQASEKGLILSQTINYGMPDTIVGDQGRLRQILVNLLSNAVKFTDKGNVSVSISSKVVKGNQSQIFFGVKDTGIGISQDKMNEIFKPFAQVERTISLKRDGVGLGLAITKNLVELMGGTICAESILGQGTTFHVMIPVETIPSMELYSGKVDRLVTSEILPRLKPMRILIAEDNPSNQRVLVEMLKRLGYRADAVADGKEVIEALERQDYDLVLMDIKMPEMDGITATQVIRKLLPEKGPKIVAITAFALHGDREKCLEAGMDDYISKPIQLKELAAILMKYSGEAA